MAVVDNTLLLVELVEVVQKVLGRALCVWAEEIPMETQKPHQASFSLNNRISIKGAIFS